MLILGGWVFLMSEVPLQAAYEDSDDDDADSASDGEAGGEP